MNKEEKRHSVLAVLEKSFADAMVPATTVREETTGIEVLNLLFEDLIEDGHTAYGEFFFIPDDDDTGLTIFESVITVAEDITADTVGEVCVAVAALNYFVTSGAFAVDVAGGRVLYRHSVEIVDEVSEEELIETCDRNMSISMQMAANYADQLLDVADGTRDAASVIEYYTGNGLS